MLQGTPFVWFNPTDLFEFKNAQFRSAPLPITDAEKLNGVEYRIETAMIVRAYRAREKGLWGNWSDGPRRLTTDDNDITADAIMAFELVKVKGRWFARPWDEQRDVLDGKLYDLPEIPPYTTRYDCKTAAIIKTPEQLAAIKAAQEASMTEADKLRRQQDERFAQLKKDNELIRDPAKGIAFMPISAADYELIKKDRRSEPPGGKANDAYFKEHFDLDKQVEALAAKFPTLANVTDDQYLSVGTTFKGIPHFEDNRPGGGALFINAGIATKQLDLVQVTSGPHNGEIAVIDSRNYASNLEYVRGADATPAKAPLIRDPAKGIAFMPINESHKALLDRNDPHFEQNSFIIGGNFPKPESITDDQYLGIGTTYKGFLDNPRDSGSGVRQIHGGVGQSLALVTVTSGPHSGQLVAIDIRNYSPDAQSVQVVNGPR